MKALFPYKTLFGDVTLDVEEVRIDREPVTDLVDLDERSIDLHGLERAQWDFASISLVVRAPPAEIGNAIDANCVAVANCGPTNNRVSVELTEDPDTPGQWRGELVIERMYWYAQAQLRAFVVATVDGTRNRIIGASAAWSLRLDDLPDRPVKGAISITWVDFGDPPDDKGFLRKHHQNYAYLSIDPDEPRLFLNQSFEGLEQLLADRRRQGLDKALHDQTRAAIADKVWSALFNTAIATVESDPDTDEAVWPSVDWQRNVLEALLPRMYPDRAIEQALADAWAANSASDSPGTLQELLAPAAAMQVRGPRLLRDGIRDIALDAETNGEEQ